MLDDRPINARGERLLDRCSPRSTSWLAMVFAAVLHKADSTQPLPQSWLSQLCAAVYTHASVPNSIWLDDTCSAQLS